MQLNQPVWIVCFSDSPRHEIHISYHDYEHYSSVRTLGDHTSDSANVRQLMTTCDPTTLNEKRKTNTSNDSSKGACAMDPPELFDEHDVEYILAQLTNPVERQLIRDTLTDNRGDIDGTIAYLLTMDIPLLPEPALEQDSIDRIMSTTGIYDVDLIQQAYLQHNLNVDLTVEALLKLTTEDESKAEEAVVEEENSDKEQPSAVKVKGKPRPASSRQVKLDKKKAKKQRAVEKHRAEIIAAAGKPPTTANNGKSDAAAAANNEQENVPPANMEFINI